MPGPTALLAWLPVDPSHYMVVDLEATCDDRGRMPKHEMETIEIGAVMVEGQGLNIVSEYQTFVRPVRHPVLTHFCRQLTTIEQADVDNAPGFPEAFAALVDWWRAHDAALFCSWGFYDRKQFEQDCAHHTVPYPFGDHHLNVKRAFAHELRLPGGVGMSRALKRVGLPLSGTHHRGIDDARNIARLLPWALGRSS